MAKKTMMKKATKKRERNKTKVEVNEKDELLVFGKTLLGVAIFVGVMYLGILGLTSLGVFEAGYTKPSKDTTEISYTDIPIGTVFNRNEDAYYVLFDKTGNDKNTYIDTLASSLDLNLYKVDMSSEYNKKYASEEDNMDATNSTELRINGITLIKIKDGSIKDYVTGEDDIASYLKENKK